LPLFWVLKIPQSGKLFKTVIEKNINIVFQILTMENNFEFDGISEELIFTKEKEFSPFVVDAIIKTVGQGMEMGGKIAEASAKKKEAEAKITEIGGKRQAQLKDCENAKEYKKFLDPKYRKNRIKDCKTDVNKRLDSEEKEQKEIVRRMTAIEENKIVQDIEKQKSNIPEKKSSKRLNVIGGIVALGLVLATIIYLKKK
jgi:hypothetical protein